MNPMLKIPIRRRRNTTLVYVAVATLLVIAAIVSRPAAAQNFKRYGCPTPMRAYYVQLYHGIGVTHQPDGYAVCVDRIDFKFDYGGPREFDSLEPDQYVTAHGFNAQQKDSDKNYGEELDRLLAQGYMIGRGDAYSSDVFDLDTFTIRFSGNFFFNGGSYTFVYGSDDGIRVWIDGHIVIDDWSDHSFDWHRKDVFIPAGNRSVVVDFYENRWRAGLYLDWSPGQ